MASCRQGSYRAQKAERGQGLSSHITPGIGVFSILSMRERERKLNLTFRKTTLATIQKADRTEVTIENFK